MRDFSSLTLRLLQKRGIRVVGTQAAPGLDGDKTFSGRVYRLDDNGCHCIRTHKEVMELAQ